MNFWATQYLWKLIGYTRPEFNPNINYEPWVIMTFQHRFIGCKNYSSLVWDVDDCRCRGAGSIWETSVPSAQFYYEPKSKTALNNTV